MSYSKIGGAAAVGSRNRTPLDVHPTSGLCGDCLEKCVGGCEVSLSAIRGTEKLYPQPFGDVTAAGIKKYPVDWGDFSISGTAVGANGLEADSDKATFSNVNIETKLGYRGGKDGIKLKIPTTVPGLGSTDVARKKSLNFIFDKPAP